MFDPNDNKEYFSASEILDLLESADFAYINDESYDLAMVTDKIDIEEMKEAIQESLTGDSSIIRKLYIDTIAGLME